MLRSAYMAREQRVRHIIAGLARQAKSQSQGQPWAIIRNPKHTAQNAMTRRDGSISPEGSDGGKEKRRDREREKQRNRESDHIIKVSQQEAVSGACPSAALVESFFMSETVENRRVQCSHPAHTLTPGPCETRHWTRLQSFRQLVWVRFWFFGF